MSRGHLENRLNRNLLTARQHLDQVYDDANRKVGLDWAVVIVGISLAIGTLAEAAAAAVGLLDWDRE